ncbi:MAG: ribonuclease D, partial [Acidimicrobiaceae bacterium]
RLFSSEILAVFHAAQQDLEVLRHASLEAPRNIFDCQVAAGFVGFSTPSLATLVQAVKKTSLSKGDRLTDWLRRPLTDQQCAYAADDVVHLFDLHDELTRQLTELGRVDWVNDACAELASRPTRPQDPSDAWLRLKEARALKGPARGVAQALAKWREER